MVATDYAGLGTRGLHQYLSIAAQAHDVIYAIPAARVALPALGARWVAVGHSQGGAAVLEVAALERSLRDRNFLGTVSLAPHGADVTIPASLTRQAAGKLCRLGDRVQYQTYPEMDHDPLVYASFRDQVRWIGARFAGEPAPSNCALRDVP